MAYIIMGGSFSPPTIAHMQALHAAAHCVADMSDIPDKDIIYAYFVPVSKSYPKKSVNEECITERARLDLIQTAVEFLQHEEKNPRIRYAVSDHEIVTGRAVTTYDSVKLFAEHTGAALSSIYIALGQDNLFGLMSGAWYKSNELLHETKILYFPRGIYDASEFNKLLDKQDDIVKRNIIRVKSFDDMSAISSTEFRRALREGTNTSIYAPNAISNKARSSYKNLSKCNSGGSGGTRRKRRGRTRRALKRHKKNTGN